MHPSLFYRPGVLLSQPELSSARLDGLLVEVGDGYMPPDLPEDADARIMSLGPILTPGYAVGGPTAAWVHGVGDAAPLRHHLHRVSERRPRVHPSPGVVIHERRIDTDDVEMVAGVPVTTRLRTLTDLALSASRNTEAASWMRRLACAEPELVHRVRALLQAKKRLPGKRAALAALQSAATYDEVTR